MRITLENTNRNSIFIVRASIQLEGGKTHYCLFSSVEKCLAYLAFTYKGADLEITDLTKED